MLKNPKTKGVKGSADCFLKVLKAKGVDTNKLVDYSNIDSEEYCNTRIDKMSRVAFFLKNAVEKGIPVTILGDYDCDGVCACSIMKFIGEYLSEKTGKKSRFNVIIPTREEGYGAKPLHIDRILEKEEKEQLGKWYDKDNELCKGILVCVDNGVAAHDAIKRARELGFTVIVLDHHQATLGNPPDANILIDPAAYPNQAKDIKTNGPGTNKYCGTGLAYNLLLETRSIWEGDEGYKYVPDRALALAAIATVADCVDIDKDNIENAKIVKNASKGISTEKRFPGINALYTQSGLWVDTDISGSFIKDSDAYAMFRQYKGKDFANKMIPEILLSAFVEILQFKSAPMINAPGRLGPKYIENELGFDFYGEPYTAESLVKMLSDVEYSSYSDTEKSFAYNCDKKKMVWGANLKRINEARKYESTVGYENMHDEIDEDSKMIIQYVEGAERGLVGLWAGKIVEEFNKPSIVFTDSTQPGVITGSARSIEGINMKELLDRHSSLLLGYGGHPGAAGLSMKKENLQKFIDEVNEDLKDFKFDPNHYYDIELDCEDLIPFMCESIKYGPIYSISQPLVVKVKVPIFSTEIKGKNQELLTINTFAVNKDGKNLTTSDGLPYLLSAMNFHCTEEMADLVARASETGYINLFINLGVSYTDFFSKDIDEDGQQKVNKDGKPSYSRNQSLNIQMTIPDYGGISEDSIIRTRRRSVQSIGE